MSVVIPNEKDEWDKKGSHKELATPNRMVEEKAAIILTSFCICLYAHPFNYINSTWQRAERGWLSVLGFSLTPRRWRGPLSRPMTASSNSALLIVIASSPTAIKADICREHFPVQGKCQTDLKVVLLVNCLWTLFWQVERSIRLAHNRDKIQLMLQGSL